MNETNLLLDESLFEDKETLNTKTKTTFSRISEMKEELEANYTPENNSTLKDQTCSRLNVSLVSLSSYVFELICL